MSDVASEAEARVGDEVVQLHRVFEAWFRGSVPRDGGLDRAREVLADDFQIVSPRGVLSSRGAVLEALDAAYGVHRDRDPSIWIEGVRSRDLGGGLLLGTYEEWQRIGGETTGRLSTVLFSAAPATPNGLAWRHVHETWLPARGPRD